ncbi:hypothetical protein R4P65_30880, partial [Rhodococcus sp. IEGM 1318]|nr:hypothetical protein [Rhodococcus sp. IEGM 1318]
MFRTRTGYIRSAGLLAVAFAAASTIGLGTAVASAEQVHTISDDCLGVPGVPGPRDQGAPTGPAVPGNTSTSPSALPGGSISVPTTTVAPPTTTDSSGGGNNGGNNGG